MEPEHPRREPVIPLRPLNPKLQPTPPLPLSSGRRAIPEQEAFAYLRRQLMDRFRADARYRAIVDQDLRPKWRPAESVISLAGGDESVDASDLAFMDVVAELNELERRSPDLRGVVHVQAYVQAVVKAVGRSMRVVTGRRPAAWALNDVHDDVMRRRRPVRESIASVRALDNDLVLRLELTPNRIDVNAFPGTDQQEGDRRRID
jgi:hypothetical protein